MIHEIFGLDDEKAAEVIVQLVKKMREKASQVETINATDERVFAAFMVGFWNGVNATRLNPWIADREAMFVADVMRKLENSSEDEVVEWLTARFKRLREEREANRCKDVV